MIFSFTALSVAGFSACARAGEMIAASPLQAVRVPEPPTAILVMTLMSLFLSRRPRRTGDV